MDEDCFAPDSYWWRFRALLDRVKGQALSSRPGCYPARNAIVRARFDALEAAFDAETPAVMRQAQAAGQPDAAALLDGFTQRCVDQVHAALDELLAAFPDEAG